jgi:hypothetical protein
MEYVCDLASFHLWTVAVVIHPPKPKTIVATVARRRR